MGVTLHDALVHEGSRVPLVAVADDVLHIALIAPDLGPLAPRGEAAASPAPQVGIGNLLSNLLRGHIKEGLFQRLIAPHRQIFLYAVGSDPAAVLQHQAGLLLEEGNLLRPVIGLAFLMIEQPLKNFPALDAALHNLGAILRPDLGIKPALRVNPHQRPLLAETGAAAFLQGHTAAGALLDIFLQLHQAGNISFLQEPLELSVDIQSPTRYAGRAGADVNPSFLCREKLLCLAPHLLQSLPAG